MEYREILDKVLILSLSEGEDKGFEKSYMEKIGEELYSEYKSNGYFRRTSFEMLGVPMYSFAYFLRKLYEEKMSTESPIKRFADSNWMRTTSLSFLNVRAVAKDTFHGDFINALKVIPTIRVDGIHLSPFFDHSLHILYAIDCLWIISDDFINKFYLSFIPAKYQLKFFIDTLHLLGKVVGFDLESHTSQFSRIALTYPEYFRWIKLENVNGEMKLADNLTQKEQLFKDYQRRIHSQVREIVREKLRKYNLRSFLKGDVSTIRTAHLEVIHELIQNGIWTIPSHTWNGIGIPEYSHYVYDKNYPEFKYINMEGNDHRDHAFGIVTPYKFYDNLEINDYPKEDNLPTIDRKVLNFFSNIPIMMIEKYGFDFIRWDYTDHVFDSILNEDFSIPVSDRITPYVIKYTIGKVKRKYPNVGMLFERMGTDFKNYYRVGADLLLGDDIWFDITKNYVKRVIRLSMELGKFNSKRSRKISICYAVDTHDTGNPLINRTPIVKEGREGVLFRYFLSRFGSAGLGTRPKYECIGTNEGTTGLYESNISVKTLNWKNDKLLNSIYHNIEDSYIKFKEILDNGTIKWVKTKGKIVYWEISNEKNSIICCVNTSRRKVVFNLDVDFSYAFDPYSYSERSLKKGDKINGFSPVILVK
ncbi:MAG: hypothetical protein ACP5KI_03815 [Brevinematia bacterium]